MFLSARLAAARFIRSYRFFVFLHPVAVTAARSDQAASDVQVELKEKN